MAGRDAHFYEPRHGHGLAHDPFKAIVAPRPIGWISSRDRAGRHNLAPYSFFNAALTDPPMLVFASGGWKDSVANLEATREFCFNLATRDLAGPMNASSATVAHEVDEFVLSGLTPAPSRLVAAPRVRESPVNFECVVVDIHRLRDRAGRDRDGWLVVGEVVGVHIDRANLADGVYDTARARPIGRGGGSDYFEAMEAGRFELERPKPPPGAGRE